MFRLISSCFLLAFLLVAALPSAALAQSVAQDVAELKAGQKIKVTLKTGELWKGRIVSIASDQFTFNDGQANVREVRFDDAQSVKRDGMKTKYKRVIGVGVTYFILVILGSYLRQNEPRGISAFTHLAWNGR